MAAEKGKKAAAERQRPPTTAFDPRRVIPARVDDLVPSEIKGRAEEIKAIPGKVSKPFMAAFITKALIALFLFQAILLTVAYLGFAWRYGSDAALLKQTTESVLEGVKSIVPATTTLLGVAIGYYFREEIARSREEEQGQSGE